MRIAITKSFTLAPEYIRILDDLTIRFTHQAGIKISGSKVIELALNEIKAKNIKELMNNE